MKDQSFTIGFSVAQSPEEVVRAIKNVRGWWSEEVTGATEKVGDAFFYRYRDVHRCTMKMTEDVAGKRVSWRVLDNYFDFTSDKSEWIDTEVRFDVSRVGAKTEVRFTHVGLVPSYECFDACSRGWTSFAENSLRLLIETGTGRPNRKELDPAASCAAPPQD